MSNRTAEQLTLAEAVEQIVYGANCSGCHETRRIDLTQLRDRLGPQFLVGDKRHREARIRPSVYIPVGQRFPSCTYGRTDPKLK